MESIYERDWRKLRALKSNALNTACECVFKKVNEISSERDKDVHQAYLALWKLIHEEDKQIAYMFDNLKRSNAIEKLAWWKVKGVISDEEFSGFNEETRLKVESLISYSTVPINNTLGSTMRYIDFRDQIRNELQQNPDGLTYPQLRETLNLPYKSPCQEWVHRLEKEIGLFRIKGGGRALIWKVE